MYLWRQTVSEEIVNQGNLWVCQGRCISVDTLSYISKVLPLVLEYRLIGLVVKVSASRAEDPGFKSRLQWDFSGVESYQ